MKISIEEQSRIVNEKLVYEVALAIYTVDYLNKHRLEWDTLELQERMTDPKYIRGRFDAHQGLARYQQFLDQAKVSVNKVIEAAACFVEASATAFPHAGCKKVAVPEFGTAGASIGHQFPTIPYTGEHKDDCPYTIASRLRGMKSVL